MFTHRKQQSAVEHTHTHTHTDLYSQTHRQMQQRLHSNVHTSTEQPYCTQDHWMCCLVEKVMDTLGERFDFVCELTSSSPPENLISDLFLSSSTSATKDKQKPQKTDTNLFQRPKCKNGYDGLTLYTHVVWCQRQHASILPMTLLPWGRYNTSFHYANISNQH